MAGALALRLLCQASATQLRSARGQGRAAAPGAASDLPEDRRGAWEASGSVNSPIDRAGEPAQLQVREQRVLSWQRCQERERGSGRGRCLPDQHGPEGETGSSPRGRAVHGPVARSVSTIPGKCAGPRSGVGEFGDVCPARACCPSYHGPGCATLPRSRSYRRKASGAGRAAAATREPAQGKTRPFPDTLQLPGECPAAHHRREGRQPPPGWAKGLPAQGHRQRGVKEAEALSRCAAHPTLQPAILNLRLR